MEVTYMKKTILIKSKKDIAQRVAEETGLSVKAATEAVNLVFQEITDTLADGGEISINGFGKFEVVERAARSGFNPATQEKIEIPASKSLKFKASKSLKDIVK
jgi:DNA-binding protein HU-beta